MDRQDLDTKLIDWLDRPEEPEELTSDLEERHELQTWRHLTQEVRQHIQLHEPPATVDQTILRAARLQARQYANPQQTGWLSWLLQSWRPVATFATLTLVVGMTFVLSQHAMKQQQPTALSVQQLPAVQPRPTAPTTASPQMDNVSSKDFGGPPPKTADGYKQSSKELEETKKSPPQKTTPLLAREETPPPSPARTPLAHAPTAAEAPTVAETATNKTKLPKRGGGSSASWSRRGHRTRAKRTRRSKKKRRASKRKKERDSKSSGGSGFFSRFFGSRKSEDVPPAKRTAQETKLEHAPAPPSAPEKLTLSTRRKTQPRKRRTTPRSRRRRNRPSLRQSISDAPKKPVASQQPEGDQPLEPKSAPIPRTAPAPAERAKPVKKAEQPRENSPWGSGSGIANTGAANDKNPAPLKNDRSDDKKATRSQNAQSEKTQNAARQSALQAIYNLLKEEEDNAAFIAAKKLIEATPKAKRKALYDALLAYAKKNEHTHFYKKLQSYKITP